MFRENGIDRVSGGPIPKLFWSHPYQNLRLRRSAQVCVTGDLASHPRGTSAKTRVWLNCRLQYLLSRVANAATGYEAAERYRCRAPREGLHHTTSVQHVDGVRFHMEKNKTKRGARCS